MIRYILRLLIDSIGLLASVTGVYFAIVSFWPILSQDGRLGVIIIGLFAISLYIQNIFLMSRWRRLMRYGKGFQMINNGFALLHKLNRKKNPDKEEIVSALEATCTGLSRTMSHITQTDCGVCIKLMAKGAGSGLEVITLCRDNEFSKRRKTHLIDKKEKTRHWVDKNTGFKTVIDNMNVVDQRYFFCNNLPALDGYYNTSIPGNNTHEVKVKAKFLRTIIRSTVWGLKYKSTIVVPIIPDDMAQEDELAGFLCVDSPRSNIFVESYDLEIMRGMADGLYNKIINYKEKIKEHLN